MPLPDPVTRATAERASARRWLLQSAVALLLAGALPAWAQAYGQWSWEGALGATQRNYRNSLDARSVNSLDERDLELRFGVDGYLLHPALGSFRAEGSAALSSYKSQRRLDTRRWGLDLSLNALPASGHPFSFYVNRQLYDYRNLAEDDPLRVQGVPDAGWSLGGRLRLRQGALRGTRIGFDGDSLGYLGAEQRRATRQEAFAEWDRSTGRFERHVRIERQARSFALAGFETRDWTLNFDQRSTHDRRPRWEMSLVGLSRDLTYGGQDSRFGSARTSQHLIFGEPAGPTFDLSYDGGFADGGGALSQSHLLLARHRRQPKPQLTLVPFAGYGVQLFGEQQVHGPQVGLAATWTRPLGRIDLTLNESLGQSWLFRSRAGTSGSDSALALTLGLSAGHGSEQGLRKDLDVSWAKNRFRLVGERVAELPDLGTSLGRAAIEDAASARLTLRHRWSWAALHSYGEAARRRPSRADGPSAPTLDTLSETLQLSAGRLALTGNVASVRVRGPETQSVSSWYAALSWRPLRVLALSGTYRSDRRESALAPPLDGERYELEADLRVGAFLLRGQSYESQERSSVTHRTNRGLVLSLSRTFAGWLPIVTGAPESGVVR
jgi:hypothetical protein